MTDDQGERQRVFRELTPHVYQRWYRPPEIILGQNDYSFSSDMWSVGCTMAEIVKLIAISNEK